MTRTEDRVELADKLFDVFRSEVLTRSELVVAIRTIGAQKGSRLSIDEATELVREMTREGLLNLVGASTYRIPAP